jgi:hypothetical protein
MFKMWFFLQIVDTIRNENVTTYMHKWLFIIQWHAKVQVIMMIGDKYLHMVVVQRVAQ